MDKPPEIGIGTQVLLENTKQKQRNGDKLEPAWLGPYTTWKCIEKGLDDLVRNSNAVKTKVNIYRLKRNETSIE